MTRNGGGLLLVVEGPEGAGKSTQVRRLGAWLERRGRAHLELREPGGTALGERIREILLDDPAREITAPAEAALFIASRAELVSRVVLPALERGTVVTLDRFFLSTYAYQAHGRGLPEGELRAANALATGGLEPDLTVLLQLPAAEGHRVLRAGGPELFLDLGHRPDGVVGRRLSPPRGGRVRALRGGRVAARPSRMRADRHGGRGGE